MSSGTHSAFLERTLLSVCLVLVLCAIAILTAACEDLGGSTTTAVAAAQETASTLPSPGGTALGSDVTIAEEEATEGEAEDDGVSGEDGGGGGSSTTLGISFAPPSSLSVGPLVTTPAWTLYQESDPHITYSSGSGGGTAWSLGSYGTASGGHVRWTVWSGTVARVKMRFNGTGIALLCLRNIDSGKARLSLDGGTPFLVDTYGSGMTSAVVWTSPDLSAGVHSLTIENTDVHNPASAGYYLLFDAVSVRGTLVY